MAGICKTSMIAEAGGEVLDPDGAYFCLRPATDVFARGALHTYATNCEATNPTLARQLFHWLDLLEAARQSEIAVKRA